MSKARLHDPVDKWSQVDYAILAALVAVASILFCSGLSMRSLWGSEGRWAVVAREMIQGGNYFLPTINGNIYFDKPLLSYWAIVPFSWFTGVTETTARLPGALAGIGTVALVYGLGRRLYGRPAAFLSGMILITTAMFGFWSRTASAELLNVLAIWLMLWVMAREDRTPSFRRYLVFYLVAAVSAFCKGPVAPAVGLITTTALSFTEMVVDLRRNGYKNTGRLLTRYFDWILSLKGSLAALCGLAVFTLLLFLPVMVTGSWDAVELMWRENVTRFFKPFDHVEPIYSYFGHIPVFMLPWTLIGIASLVSMKEWEAGWTRRWMVCVTIAIFMFFTISGSRRSYYILPIVPAFALITGTSLAGFLERRDAHFPLMKNALLITGFFPLLSGIALTAAYFVLDDYRHISELILGPLISVSGVLAVFLIIYRRRFVHGTAITIILFFSLLMWGYTTGASIGERQRTLRSFVSDLQKYLREVDNRKIAMYRMGNSSLIYYLGMPEPIRRIDEVSAACAHVSKPGNYLLTEEALAEEVLVRCGPENLVPVLMQPHERKKRDREGLVLLRTGRGA